MQQAIHIFLKDARRSWLYIAVVLALTAMLTVLDPRWDPMYDSATRKINTLVGILQFLLPAAWWFTMAQVIHADSLVGDRQFWVTRPYSWKSLFAAKVLFFLAFLVLPHLISDWIVLSADGFSPQTMIPGLLWRQCSLFGERVLPACFLAVVTRNMRQLMLACFLVVVSFIAIIGIEQFRPTNAIASALASATQPGAGSWLSEWTGTILYGGGALALLIWQYAQRRTGAGRGLVAALCVWGVAWSVWPSPAIAWTPQKRPPLQYPEIALSFVPERSRLGRDGVSGVPDKVQVDIPIALTGRNRDLLDVEMASVEVRPEGGADWNSPWTWYVQASQRGGADWMEIHFNRADFQRLSRSPMRIRAIFGVIVYDKLTTVPVRPADRWVNIPGFGKIEVRYEDRYLYLWWRAPLRDPLTKFIVTTRDQESGDLYLSQHAGIYPLTSEPAFMSPQVFDAAGLEGQRASPFVPLHLPPNGLCEFTLERPVALIRRDLQIPSIRLEDYVVGR